MSVVRLSTKEYYSHMVTMVGHICNRDDYCPADPGGRQAIVKHAALLLEHIDYSIQIKIEKQKKDGEL